MGDREYGWTKKHSLAAVGAKLRSRLGPLWPGRQMLHAAALKFTHPETNEPVEVVSNPPIDMREVIDLVFDQPAMDLDELARIEDE